MTGTFVYKAHGWKYEMSHPNADTRQSYLTVESQVHDDDPGAGSNLVKLALYRACEILKVSTVGAISHSGGWCQCLVRPDAITLATLISDHDASAFVMADDGNGSGWPKDGSQANYDDAAAEAFGHIEMERLLVPHFSDDGQECLYASQWIDGKNGYRFRIYF